jgi:hypothetical protein
MNAVSEQIRGLIEDDSSLGLVFNTNLFIGKKIDVAESPIVVIYDTAGVKPTTDLAQMAEYRYDSAQILVNASTYTSAQKKAEELFQFLRNQIHVLDPEDSGVELTIQINQSPFLLEYDERNRVSFIFNINIERSSTL